MNRAIPHLAALALPLLGLAASWLLADNASKQGTEWEVPVQGYDPRDFLQGHYVMYQYAWPGLGRDAGVFGRDLCLSGRPPRIDRVTAASGPCANRIALESGPWGGRLYVSQAAALKMQRQLADRGQQGVLRFRLRPDGTIVPLELTFRQRPAEPVQP